MKSFRLPLLALLVCVIGCAPEVKPRKTLSDPNQLLSEFIGGGKYVDKVEMRKLDLQPGEGSRAFSHPIPVSGYVVAGKVRLHVDGEAEQLLTPGQAYFKPANTRIRKFEAVDGPAQVVESYLLGNKDNELIKK